MAPRDPEEQKRKEAIKRADIRLLAQLGYKQEFQRAFKPLEVFGIAFSIIGLLPSISSVMYYSLPNGGGPAMVWGWLVASLLILCVGMSMGELASAAPTSGGLYFWAYSLSSPRWKRLMCWIVGYANTIGNVAAVASIDWGCAIQVMAAVTIATDGEFSPTNPQLFGTFAAVVVTHGIVCCLGTAVLARLQTVYIILNILLCMVVIVVLPITTPPEFRNTPQTALFEFTNFNGWPNGFAFICSFLAPLWTICSFDSSVHIAEEASNAAVSVPWGIVNAISVAGILGWAINMVLAFCMGPDLEGLWNSDQPMAVIFVNSFGKNATLAIWVVVVIVQYMMGSSMLLGTSRQVFAFSRDGALPLSRWIYRINSRTQTPINAAWWSVFFTVAMGLLAFIGDQAIDAAFALSVAALYVAYAIPIAARFLGENNFEPGPFYLGRFSAPCALISVLFMTVMSVVFMFPTSPDTTTEDMNYTVAVLFGVLFLSLVWYYFPVYGGVYWFKGPVKTVGNDHHDVELDFEPKLRNRVPVHVSTEPSASFFPGKATGY
ncbi:amino acid transporter [Coprinopsis marcescibilis]|uniref:Amino acid transporter n=1 Tax=Coprinopsis marcescibilis TaxID=230819 RepID=A0A5C3KZQ7_COPMA|nr:amino acid transporter [Coprinopsis marcescibilis]